MRLRRVFDVLRARFAGPAIDRHFDPAFYRRNYPDLAELRNDRELYRHYMLHGRAEGRFRNYAELVARLEDRYGSKLPDGFDPREYISLYADLQDARMSEGQAVEHYLRYGHAEGRAPFRLRCDIYRELYCKGQLVSDQDLKDEMARGFGDGRIRTGADVMKAKGVDGGGRWIEAIEPDEFALLNFAWAGQISSRMEAVDVMLSHGLDRLAPISFALEFDPEFYRETHPSLAAASDSDCYRHWLFVGFEQGEPGSPRQFFTDLGVRLESFPRSFRWKHYSGLGRWLDKTTTRWSAFGHFVREGFARGRRPVKGPDAVTLYTALGDYFRNRNPRLSVESYELAQRLSPLDESGLEGLADGYSSLGQWTLALATYEARLRLPHPDVRTICNGARAALKLGEIERAFDILRAGKEAVAGAPDWRDILREAIEAEFSAAYAEARGFLAADRRSLADGIVTDAVARVAARFAELDPLGVPLPAGTGAKVVMLANIDLRQCTHYRVEQKQQLLEALGRDYEIYSTSEVEGFISALPGASAAIFYRVSAFPMIIRAIEVAHALGIPTYYDIDDLVFDPAEYPEPYDTYGSIDRGFYEGLQLGVPLFRAAMSLCDYGIASTTVLATYMKPVVRKQEAFVLPNGLDHRNLPFLDGPPLRSRNDGSIVIFYGSGTKAHNSDFLDLAGPALVRVMTRHPQVKLMIVGYLTLDETFDAFRDRIVRIGWTPDIRSYWSLLAEADITIAVLACSATTDAKSEIKWLEAAALGIPSVVSGTARYKEVLEDGVDVLIADDAEGWASALERLVVDAELRARIAQRAKVKAASLYSLEANAGKLAALLPPVPRARSEATATPTTKRRVLLVNVYFSPQSLGGSARVVRDNLDCFLEGKAADEFDFAVVTTDFGGDGRNELRVETYRECPVFRLSPIAGHNSEWQPDLPEMDGIFARILDLWRPDLVHFHCIQRLSASIVEACLEAGIPYIDSLHDAWWISDWQFLTDHKGHLRYPPEPIPFDPPAPVGVGEALERRRLLASLLHRSEAVLGASEAFTELHKSCGFDRAIAVPNGTPPLATAPRIASASGRVRLAHIGYMAKFKGFFLVQAVLRQSRFENLELTVVDQSRYGGSEHRETWGATPVRIVGKTIADRMHEFYAGQDVLLAPSLWPEAFGLVSREALSAGLWVVASDRGAIGEDITPGINGWAIDVGTPQALLSVLSEINSDPEKYLRSPPPARLRSASEQADDLVAIYRDVLARPRKPTPPYERRTVEKGLPPPEPKFDLRHRRQESEKSPAAQ